MAKVRQSRLTFSGEMKEFSDTSKSINLSDQEIASRKSWLCLDSKDEKLISHFKPALQESIDKVIEELYVHFLSMDEPKSFFPDEQTLSRVKQAQKAYFSRLVVGDYGKEYVEDRLRVGSTHFKIDLDPKWYLGAYSRVISLLLPSLYQTCQAEKLSLVDSVSSLIKIIFFDVTLAIEAYHKAREDAIKLHRDIMTELETERRVTRSVLEGSPVGIVRLSPDLNCIEFNNEFYEMLQIAKREPVTGRNLLDLTPKLDASPFREVLESGKPFRQDAQALNLSRSEHSSATTYWDLAIWPVRDNKSVIIGIIAMFGNATERVLLQQQREDFVATLTHDLKTPILAANRAVKLLMEGDFGTISESQVTVLQTIHESNDALYKLVTTLLDVYRFDSGAKNLHFTTHDLRTLLNKILDELRPLANQKNIQLAVSIPEDANQILCDIEEFRRLIQNVVDNALKYTTGGGQINLEVISEPQMWTFKIKDTGRGIAEEDMPKLFQRFWQAANTSGRYYASTGLGLYLCRKIVELHGGQIWCESKLGQGSTFAFTISKKLLPSKEAKPSS